MDGKLYATGSYGVGRLGINTSSNVLKFTEVNIPSTSKVKYFRAGITNTSLVLADGSVWETGFNLNGELGNGTNTTSTTFVKGLKRKRTSA